MYSEKRIGLGRRRTTTIIDILIIIGQVFPRLEIECFIQKPIELQDLVRRINAELK
jgi:hypothetical protein